eukprot:6177113-Prymnesium_polylepis.1
MAWALPHRPSRAPPTRGTRRSGLLRRRSEADHRRRQVAACVLSSPCWPPAVLLIDPSTSQAERGGGGGVIIRDVQRVQTAMACRSCFFDRPRALASLTVACGSNLTHLDAALVNGMPSHQHQGDA